jgi:SAM-dependent methyltransferase
VYNTTAFLYESTAAFEQPEKACDDIHRIFARCGIKSPGLIGDLGAGTGLMSVLLAKRGWNVYGVEQSSAMLAVARQKLMSLPADVQARLTWIEGDITTFEMPPELRLDGAICLCNTINHLVEPSQVAGFAQATFWALKPNGVLILDSDALRTFQNFFHHPPTVVWDDGQHRMTRACDFDATTGRAHHVATLEQYTATGLQPVSEEPMPLQYHSEAALRDAFSAAGFQLKSAKPYNPNPVLYGGFFPKVLWVWRKP